MSIALSVMRNFWQQKTNMIRYGKEQYKITLQFFDIGNDLLLIITGGKEHIGSASLIDNNHLSTLNKIGHKDDIISRQVAPLISKKIKKDLLVVCGIHLDNATQQDIKILTHNVNICVEEFLLKY